MYTFLLNRSAHSVGKINVSGCAHGRTCKVSEGTWWEDDVLATGEEQGKVRIVRIVWQQHMTRIALSSQYICTPNLGIRLINPSRLSQIYRDQPNNGSAQLISCFRAEPRRYSGKGYSPIGLRPRGSLDTHSHGCVLLLSGRKDSLAFFNETQTPFSF